MKQYIEITTALVVSNLKGRYESSHFGFLWTLVTPLFQMIIFVFVFGIILKRGSENYPVFLLCGILAWNLFSQTVTRGMNAFTSNATLIKNIPCPRILFVVVPCLVTIVELGFSCLVLIPFLFYYSILPQINLLFLPAAVLLITFFALGLSLLLASINVFARDISQFIPTALRLWFFLTPIFYDTSFIPEKVHHLFELNPMVGGVTFFRWCIMESIPPSAFTLLSLSCQGVFILLFAYAYFKRMENELVKAL